MTEKEKEVTVDWNVRKIHQEQNPMLYVEEVFFQTRLKSSDYLQLLNQLTSGQEFLNFSSKEQRLFTNWSYLVMFSLL